MKSTDVAMATMAAALSKAKTAQKLISHLDDEISATLREVEASLTALHFGVPFEVLTRTEFENGGNFEEFLQFRKVGKKWRLMRFEGMDVEDTEWTATPITDLNRDARAKVLYEDVPVLIAHIGDALERRVQFRTKALEIGSEIVAVLKNGQL